jgi:hypothetical protein
LKNTGLGILFFFIALYLFTAQGFIQTSDGMSMYLLTTSIVEHGSLSIDAERTEILSQGREGKYFTKYGVGQPLLAVPFYLTGVALAKISGIPEHFTTLFSVSLFNPIISSLVCFFVLLCAHEMGFDHRISLFLPFAYGLSTSAWHYSQDFMSEPLTTLFLLMAFYFMLRAHFRGENYYFYSGCAIGCALIVRPASVLAVPCYLIYSLLREGKEDRWLQRTCYFLIALVPFFFIVLLYNYFRFESLFNFGYSSHGFSTPLWVGVVGHLFTPGKSIFLYNPILVIAVIGFYNFIKARPHEALLVGLVFLGHLILYSKWECWMGGMCWGSRFLMVTFPYLVLSSGFLLLKKGRMWWKISVVLVGIGFLVQLPALIVNVSRYHYTLRVAHGDQMMNKLIYTPQDSPLVGQWREVMKVAGNLKNPHYLRELTSLAKNQTMFIGKGDEEVLNCGLALNVPNFWWFYLYLYGFPLWVISGVLCLLIFCIALLGYRSYEACKG